MITLLEIGLANGLVATGLALLAFCVSRVCRRPAVVHGLWLLVLLKLVTPPLVPWHVPWTYRMAPLPAAPVTLAKAPVKPAIVVASRTKSDANPTTSDPSLLAKEELEAQVGKFLLNRQPPTEDGRSQDAAGAGQGNPRRVDEDGRLSLQAAALARERHAIQAKIEFSLTAAAWVWLSGTVCWFALAAVRIGRFHRLLRHAQPAPTPVLAHAQRLAAQLGLRRCPELWLMPGNVAPLVWATGGRAQLYFPARLLEYLDPEERTALLLHELAHVRRHDHWVRWLELVAMGIYWWYPLVWWGCRMLQAAEEDCCDAWVVAELQGAEKTYASALLDTVDFLSLARSELPPVASGMARFHDLQRRLALIMQGGTPKCLSRAGRVALVAVALFLLPITPAPADPKKPASLPLQDKSPTPPAPAKLPPRPDEPVDFDSKPNNLQLADAGAIWTISYSPDGKRLATASGGNGDRPGELTVWDAATREEIYTIKEADSLRSLAFSPDNQLLATGGFDKTVKLREAQTGKLLASLRGHQGGVNSVAFSPDGNLLATGSLDSTVKIWEMPGGKLERTLGVASDLGEMSLGRLMSKVRSQVVPSGHSDWVLSVTFSPDGKMLASASRDQTAKVWDVATGKERMTLRGHTNWVECVRFTPDSQAVATASWDFTVKLWDVATGRGRGTLLAHNGYALSITFTRDGKIMATSGADSLVKLWDVATLSEMSEFRLNPGSIYGLAFSPDDKMLATGSWDKTARLWDVAAGQEVARLERKEYLPMNTPALLAAAYSPNGKLLAVGSDNQTVKVYDVPGSRLLTVLRGHKDVVSAVGFSPDGATLASGSYDKTIMLWDVAKFTRPEPVSPRAALEGHTNWIFSIALSPDGRTLASGGYDKAIRLWDILSGQAVATLSGHSAGVRSVAFSPDGALLASGSTDRTVRIWDLATRAPSTTFKGHKGTIHAVAFSPDGKTVASASEDMTVVLWDRGAGKERIILKGNAEVWCLAFSPQGKTLATSGADNLVKLWDPATGSERAALRGHADTVTALAFAPGAKQLVSASLDKTLKIWNSRAVKVGAPKGR